jgi:hypothetical protein
MRQSFQDSEQRLLRASVNLLNQRAEVQKLREAIQSAEVSKRSRGLSRPPKVSEVLSLRMPSVVTREKLGG